MRFLTFVGCAACMLGGYFTVTLYAMIGMANYTTSAWVPALATLVFGVAAIGGAIGCGYGLGRWSK